MTTRTRGRLAREEITAAALELIDEEGVEHLTMRRLGKQLGVDPMAIYHHLPNKTAVLDGVIELLWRGVRMPAPAVDERWQDVLHSVFSAFRERLLEHPRAVAIVGTRPMTTPAMLTLVEATIARLEAAGLPGREAMPLIDGLAGYTIGKLLAEVALLEGGAVEQVRSALGTISPETHPHLVRTMDHGYAMAPDEQFHRGLRALIEGWRAGN